MRTGDLKGVYDIGFRVEKIEQVNLNPWERISWPDGLSWGHSTMLSSLIMKPDLVKNIRSEVNGNQEIFR